ncbi:pleckstrin homology domain-containing family A member 2-like [Hydractinia symbiolongicarpus]|uniref:pleckstrin homology domain-containing family A member 2-like n=1 Tax=Hydractinia symbiolongicarpus TaxID=13093 RepID=UPI0025517C9D|nr:pleckstrin homology domain-containing family A member 2-like [Hydractinia symbiolongicarpus]
MGIAASQPQQQVITHTNICTRTVQVMPSSSGVNKKEGELLKYKNVLSGWGKRYFKLERTYLHYFETKHTHKPLATVTRGEISEVKPSKAFPGKVNVFEILLKSGIVWYCQASSPEDMVSWLQSLSPIPIMLDSTQYPTIPLDEAFVEIHAPPPQEQMQPSPFPPVSPLPPSPYRDLMHQAHHTAQTCNTPHVCQHYSPPPPYSAEESLPPVPPPPDYSMKPFN